MREVLLLAVFVGGGVGVLALDHLVSERKRGRESRDAVRRALGNDLGAALAFRPGSSRPWRIAYGGTVWAFADRESVRAFLDGLMNAATEPEGFAPHPHDFGGVFADHPSRGLPW